MGTKVVRAARAKIIREILISNALEGDRGLTIKEIVAAAPLSMSVAQAKTAMMDPDEDPKFAFWQNWVTSTEEFHDSWSKNYPGMRTGLHKVRVFYASREALCEEIRGKHIG